MTPHLVRHPYRTTPTVRRTMWTGFSVAAAVVSLGACGGSSGGSTTASTSATGSIVAPSGDVVLPVTSNPIANTATEPLLTIDSVLVENNLDPATGKAADDHLEIAITNTSTSELSGFEVYTTISDPTTSESESYYTALPAEFAVVAGATRTIHFDSTGAPDHFPDDPYSLYHSSRNALDVTVEVSATGAAPQTATVQKDPGGEEVAD